VVARRGFAGGAQAVEEDHGAVHDQRTGLVDGGGQHCRAGVDGGSDAAAGVAVVGFGLAVDGAADVLHAGGRNAAARGAAQPPGAPRCPPVRLRGVG
jgi:hypothetical protein